MHRVVELRRYTLRPGMRERFISLFDTELVDPQEAVGMHVIGHFRDLRERTKIVWIRSFPDMEARAEMLATFYDGPVWQTHRGAANATIVDSNDVLLLRPPHDGAQLVRTAPPEDGARADRTGVAATILHLDPGASADDAVTFFEDQIVPAVAGGGGTVLGYFVSEKSANTFRRLPVREDANVLVWLSGTRSSDVVPYARSKVVKLAAATPGLVGLPQIIRLGPTSRSRLDGGAPPCAAAAQQL